MHLNTKSNIVISAINFFEGGPLSILHDCIREVSKSQYNTFQFIVLVHKKDLFDEFQLPEHIQLIEFPKSRRSYFYRLYYEFFYFNEFSKKEPVFLWFSLHDISPRVKAEKQVVYCHNPTPFFSLKLKHLRYPGLVASTLLYKYLYRINIHANRYVIVQQEWLRKSFSRLFGIDRENIIVATPILKYNTIQTPQKIKLPATKTVFFYPSFPRPFKNFEVIVEATKILINAGYTDFRVILTIDGKENKYSKLIKRKAKGISQIEFIGRISRDEVFKIYNKTDALLFPSQLETWGLPISEFKRFKSPILLADRIYAREALGVYDEAIFLDSEDKEGWATTMKLIIEKDSHLLFDPNIQEDLEQPHASTWTDVFNILLNFK